jgi:hypothetical protein
MPVKSSTTINLRPLSHIAFALAVMDELYGPGWQPEELVQERLRNALEAGKEGRSQSVESSAPPKAIDCVTEPDPIGDVEEANKTYDQSTKAMGEEDQ